MKKMISVVLAGCLAVSLAACGGSSNTSASSSASSAASSEAAEASSAESVTLTGEGEGFGGTITATVVKTGDAITSVTFEAPDETENVGGAALEDLSAQIVEANGTEIDGVSGATLTTQGCKDAVDAALASESEG